MQRWESKIKKVNLLIAILAWGVPLESCSLILGRENKVVLFGIGDISVSSLKPCVHLDGLVSNWTWSSCRPHWVTSGRTVSSTNYTHISIMSPFKWHMMLMMMKIFLQRELMTGVLIGHNFWDSLFSFSFKNITRQRCSFLSALLPPKTVLLPKWLNDK